MITYDGAEAALNYLLSTDDEYARVKGIYDELSDQRKTVLAIEYLKHTGSAAEKLKLAESSETYQAHLIKTKEAQFDYEIIKNKRATQSIVIDMWRSINAAQRMGNI